ncbi:Ubiquitin-conjugating_enzyme E2 [Hexamita inflata]|uniref:Ubiquitin-conjugating enzyme E2 n=1 Tax=Hexamita inflata TaxID=28002 RepID=A0AA86V307_9EUKA|nr:Ubiquitin-conjugating enzyme E2 [Hexamita inflata]CAI9978268.1 Ubiquitin-conjugating enzyme E2 [Hexamita inflata]
MAARLKNEVKQAVQSRDQMLALGIDYHPRSMQNLFEWVIYLKFQDKESPYFNQTHEIDVRIPVEYPFKHPTCKFNSKIFHPNIEADSGKICLNIINEGNTEWTSANTIQMLALGLQSLVYGPNCDSPLNLDAGSIFRNGDSRAFKSLVNYYYKSQ